MCKPVHQAMHTEKNTTIKEKNMEQEKTKRRYFGKTERGKPEFLQGARKKHVPSRKE